MKKTVLFFLALCFSIGLFAQGTLSGDLMMNLNIFQTDTNIKAGNNPLYDHALSGNEGWLSVRYSNNNGISATLRADVFGNSNLANPSQAMSGFGVGAWNITKDFKDLTVSVGYIYDQIGSGILFRAYEDRGLLIDNAIIGLELKYKLTDKILIKGFTGQQKNIFTHYEPIIKGFNAEGDYNVGKVHLIPGVGFLDRTLDDGSMASVAQTINSYADSSEKFFPRYNMYAFSAYNTLTYKSISWYAEGAYKTHEAILVNNLLIDKPGNVEYTTINYAKKGFAINLATKRTENFVMRTSPNEVLLKGMLNWQPVVAVLRPERLISRYTPASQDISEMAANANMLITPNDVTNFTFTYAHINTLDNVALYHEVYGDVVYQGIKSWQFQLGAQYLEYNQKVYQVNAATGMVYAITPFTEITYRVTDTKSLRFEAQYMNTKQDYGSWVFALLEYNIAPMYSISVSDMYNIDPNYSNPAVTKANHYYNIYGAYTKGPHRFSLAYVKQVDGINCTGGVCRYEPAFSGIKGTVTTSF